MSEQAGNEVVRASVWPHFGTAGDHRNILAVGEAVERSHAVVANKGGYRLLVAPTMLATMTVFGAGEPVDLSSNVTSLVTHFADNVAGVRMVSPPKLEVRYEAISAATAFEAPVLPFVENALYGNGWSERASMATIVVDQLKSLEDGWCGEGSRAPSVRVRNDVAQTLSLFSVSAQPIIEVDDDGSVALLWEDDDRTFALTFFGNGKVTGTLSPSNSAYPSWTKAVSDAPWLIGLSSGALIAPLLA